MAAEIYIRFDGGPGPDDAVFVEVEDTEGKSVTAGEWRPDVGTPYWRLGPFYTNIPTPAYPGVNCICIPIPGDKRPHNAECPQRQIAAEAKIERLLVAGNALLEAGDATGTPETNRAFMETVHAWDRAKK